MIDRSGVRTTIEAAVLREPGRELHVEELTIDPPARGEVKVAIQASGVCHSDVRLADGEWEFPGPLVLGHEGSGIVEAVGDGVERPRLGEHVALSWFPPCLRCEACQSGRQWLCSGTNSLDHRLSDGRTPLRDANGDDILPCLGLGVFADSVVVPAEAAITVPQEVPFEVAALIGCCVSTGVGSVLKTADVPAGSSVAVIGLGGVGQSVIMGAMVAGAGKIVAVDRMRDKLDKARALGASNVVMAAAPDETVEAVHELSGGGVDFAFEAVGSGATIEQALRSVRPGGTVVLVGMTAEGVRPSFDSFDLVDRSLRILGSNYGFASPVIDFPRYAKLYLSGRLPIDALIEGRIELHDVNAALAALRGGQGGRQVIHMDEGSRRREP